MDAPAALPEWPPRSGETEEGQAPPPLPLPPRGSLRRGRRRGPLPARGSRANGHQTLLVHYEGAPEARARREQPRGPVSRRLPVAREGLPALAAARPGTSRRPGPPSPRPAAMSAPAEAPSLRPPRSPSPRRPRSRPGRASPRSRVGAAPLRPTSRRRCPPHPRAQSAGLPGPGPPLTRRRRLRRGAGRAGSRCSESPRVRAAGPLRTGSGRSSPPPSGSDVALGGPAPDPRGAGDQGRGGTVTLPAPPPNSVRALSRPAAPVPSAAPIATFPPPAPLGCGGRRASGLPAGAARGLPAQVLCALVERPSRADPGSGPRRLHCPSQRRARDP
nr:translation initiation factor IF-2-like [Desmodus rotundus]